MTDGKTTIIRVNVGKGEQLNATIRELMWFQRVHNKDYHQDIYHMPTMRQIQHHCNHLSKYFHAQFNDTGIIKEEAKFKDALACIFSMCAVLGFNPLKHMECGGAFGNIDIHEYDRYGAPSHFRDALSKVIKAVEGYDHIEDIDYRGVVTTNLVILLKTTVTMGVYGYHGFNTVDEGIEGITPRDRKLELLNSWYSQLEKIKKKHCFYDYFEREHNRCDTIKYIHRCFR